MERNADACYGVGASLPYAHRYAEERMNGIFSFQGLYREATCPLLKQAVSLSSDRGVGGTQPSKRAASSGASPEAPPRRDVLYINKWYTFAACALLQLLMGVQYCFPCALPNSHVIPTF